MLLLLLLLLMMTLLLLVLLVHGRLRRGHLLGARLRLLLLLHALWSLQDRYRVTLCLRVLCLMLRRHLLLLLRMLRGGHFLDDWCWLHNLLRLRPHGRLNLL